MVNPEPFKYPFEGCEKRLVIKFRSPSPSPSPSNANTSGTVKESTVSDLRSIDSAKWTEILYHAKCSILSTITNDDCVAHLLSESSLFVFADYVMIKTCGTTALLNILSVLETHVKSVMNLEMFAIDYSRSNFMFPAAQPVLYQSFENEAKFVDDFIADKLGIDAKGNAVILGRHKAKWHCYEAVKTNVFDETQAAMHNNKTLEVVMFDLDAVCMQLFVAQNRKTNNIAHCAVDQHVVNGCCIPSQAEIDSFLFEPCGYSLNALLGDKYWSIHITPETNSSFVSFESNYDYADDENVVQRLLQTFKPKRFGVVRSYGRKRGGDDDGDGGKKQGWDCKFGGYGMVDEARYQLSARHDVQWCHFVLHERNNKSCSLQMLIAFLSLLVFCIAVLA